MHVTAIEGNANIYSEILKTNFMWQTIKFLGCFITEVSISASKPMVDTNEFLRIAQEFTLQ